MSDPLLGLTGLLAELAIREIKKLAVNIYSR